VRKKFLYFSKIWLIPQFTGAELCVKSAVEKVSAMEKNTKYNKEILCFSMHRNKKIKIKNKLATPLYLYKYKLYYYKIILNITSNIRLMPILR